MCPYDNTFCCAGDLDPHYFAPRRQLNKAQAESVILVIQTVSETLRRGTKVVVFFCFFFFKITKMYFLILEILQLQMWRQQVTNLSELPPSSSSRMMGPPSWPEGQHHHSH